MKLVLENQPFLIQMMWKRVKWWKIGEELSLYHCIRKAANWRVTFIEGLAC